jgi:hypothetical protein
MDLSKQPPRRPTNTGMAGIAGLARMTDKTRGHNAELIGAYIYGDDSGLDKGVLEFIGMSADEYAEAADGMDDGALAELALRKSGKSASEIAAFNKEHVEREPQDDRHRELLVERVANYAPERTDVKTVYQSMELDDWGMFRDLDLTAGPPRTAYLRTVAGIVGAARMADKARAAKADKLGDYKYGDDSSLDGSILELLGISAVDFLEGAYRNPNDLELTEWIAQRSSLGPGRISALNARLTIYGLHTPGYEERFAKRRDEVCPDRPEVQTYFDLMDIDDQQTFGIADLTRRPPRSAYDTSFGGITGLGRSVDKGRAHISGHLGDYWFGEDSGFDRRILEFLGLTQEEFTACLEECADDESVLARLGDRLNKPEEEIDAFNDGLQLLGPANEQQWGFLRGLVDKLDPSRTDLDTFCAVTALDDTITFARLKAGV